MTDDTLTDTDALLGAYLTPTPSPAPVAASGRNRRRFTRVSLDASVHVKALAADVLFDSRIRDLSENGVFILTEATRPIGTGIDLHIEVERDGMVVKATGIIVHEVTPAEATPDRPCGVGVMFTHVDPTTTSHLQTLLAQGKPLP